MAVGFVELGYLLTAELRDGKTGAGALQQLAALGSQLGDEGSSPEALRFVGIESSPYAVAKSLVIWQMLKQTPAASSVASSLHLVAVMQAWFSTTWVSGTRAAVESALSALRSSGEVYHDEVQGLLDH